MAVNLDDPDLRECFEGVIPSTVATCAADGTPNITYVSQAHYVDAGHLALSYQFFNKTRQNVLTNPRAAVAVVNPSTGGRYRLDAEYLRTETSGPLFESMKAKLAGIASHTGMSGVFRLLGSDVYRVLAVEQVTPAAAAGRERRPLLTALRAVALRIAQSADLSVLLDEVLEGLEARLQIHHAMVLMLDARGRRLYTVASRGYAQPGVGSEIALGCGVIGVAADQRTPIRISHMTADYSYGRAVRESLERAGLAGQLETAIPLPGLPHSRSQMAVPICAGAQVLGVLYVESPEDLRFGYEDEDALVLIASQMALAIKGLADAPGDVPEAPAAHAPAPPPPAAGAATTTVRHYPADDSIFVGNDYLIKGVAGAILAALVREFLATHRTEFTNRELRLHPAIALPDISDNLEARLVLLQRRLASRATPIQIEKTGRGRFRLAVTGHVALVEMPGPRG